VLIERFQVRQIVEPAIENQFRRGAIKSNHHYAPAGPVRRSRSPVGVLRGGGSREKLLKHDLGQAGNLADAAPSRSRRADSLFLDMPSGFSRSIILISPPIFASSLSQFENETVFPIPKGSSSLDFAFDRLQNRRPGRFIFAQPSRTRQAVNASISKTSVADFSLRDRIDYDWGQNTSVFRNTPVFGRRIVSGRFDQ
jgi:hypothetical protein